MGSASQLLTSKSSDILLIRASDQEETQLAPPQGKHSWALSKLHKSCRCAPPTPGACNLWPFSGGSSNDSQGTYNILLTVGAVSGPLGIKALNKALL